MYESHCTHSLMLSLKILFFSLVVLGPLPLTIENRPTRLDTHFDGDFLLYCI